MRYSSNFNNDHVEVEHIEFELMLRRYSNTVLRESDMFSGETGDTFWSMRLKKSDGWLSITVQRIDKKPRHITGSISVSLRNQKTGELSYMKAVQIYASEQNDSKYDCSIDSAFNDSVIFEYDFSRLVRDRCIINDEGLLFDDKLIIVCEILAKTRSELRVSEQGTEHNSITVLKDQDNMDKFDCDVEGADKHPERSDSSSGCETFDENGEDSKEEENSHHLSGLHNPKTCPVCLSKLHMLEYGHDLSEFGHDKSSLHNHTHSHKSSLHNPRTCPICPSELHMLAMGMQSEQYAERTLGDDELFHQAQLNFRVIQHIDSREESQSDEESYAGREFFTSTPTYNQHMSFEKSDEIVHFKSTNKYIEVEAHKSLSPFSGKRERNSAMFEKKSYAKIVDEIDQSVMIELSRYTLTGKVNNLEQIADRLFIAAAKYGLEDLKVLCGTAMCKGINRKNICDRLIMANQFPVSLARLKVTTIEYFKRHLNKVGEFKGYSELLSDHPTLVAEIFQSLSPNNH